MAPTAGLITQLLGTPAAEQAAAHTTRSGAANAGSSGHDTHPTRSQQPIAAQHAQAHQAPVDPFGNFGIEWPDGYCLAADDDRSTTFVN
ncbi:hypothetical protein ACAW74_15395 [Fibrella sp. WM1]|uniref:hypothetical protein n=1 Tax=Fibrella musci TaxID=3242485 RepID=UPI00352005A4